MEPYCYFLTPIENAKFKLLTITYWSTAMTIFGVIEQVGQRNLGGWRKQRSGKARKKSIAGQNIDTKIFD